MKKIHKKIDQWSSDIEDRWKLLGPKQQRKCVLIFSAAYLIITAMVMVFAWNEGRHNYPKNSDSIRHINNPLLNEKNPLKYLEHGRAK